MIDQYPVCFLGKSKLNFMEEILSWKVNKIIYRLKY